MSRNVEYIILLRDQFSGKAKRINSSVKSLDRQMNSLKRTAAALFTGFLAKKVIGDIISVGSTFEQLDISFTTMLGSAEKAKVLIGELTEFAIKTPFQLTDVSKGAKALLAYGIAQEKILPTLKSLGDVAAGLSVPIERIILNFGQVRSQSRLTGREMRDFAIAGVPLLETLSDTLGKSVKQIKAMISTGDISFADVENAFQRMSGEGGKFFNLMQKQTASTGGQISNMRDIIALLQRDIFEQLQPTINSIIDTMQRWIAILRANVDTIILIGKWMVRLVGFIIAYKLVMLATIGIIKLATAAQTAYRIAVVLTSKGLRTAIVMMKAFKIALIKTGIGAAIVLIGGLVAAMAKSTTATKRLLTSQEKLKKVSEKFNKVLVKEQAALNTLFRLAKNENVSKQTRAKAIEEINKQYGEYLI